MRPIVSVVTPPAAAPISLAEVKAHLHVDTTDEDTLIGTLITAAVADLDAPGGWLGSALATQTLRLTAPHFPGCCDRCDWDAGWGWGWRRGSYHEHEIRLPWPPVQSVGGVVYLDPASGAEVTLDPSAYLLVGRHLYPAVGRVWPATAWRPDAVRVTYVAGRPADDPDMASVKAALLLRVGALYGRREDATAPQDVTSERLLSRLRVWA